MFLTTTIDAVAFRDVHFRWWASKSGVGSRCLYHVGELARDITDDPKIREMKNLAMALSDTGIVRLTQDRAEQGLSLYIATRTDAALSSGPWNVISGKFSATHYQVIRALDDEIGASTAMSAARIIRDRLSLTESESAMMFKEMVQCGYITTRPLALTELGVKLLS